jgi:hypothetical protein
MLLVPIPIAIAAVNGPSTGQRIDLRVLLLSPAASDSQLAAWQQELGRVGVPYDTYVTGVSPALTDATLADYGGDLAKYDAVIVTSGGLALAAAEQAALTRFEETFGIREISDNTNVDSAHGATLLAGGGVTTAAQTATLTTAGQTVFPYLKGNIPIPAGVFAAGGTPGPSFTSLVNAPAGGSYLGVFTRPDGTEQMVDGIPGNASQSHFQLLRDGMLNWVTRGVHLGYVRNYLEFQVDDLFLGDDAWDPTTHTTNFDPAVASRMTPADLAQAAAWSAAHHFRLDFAYNAGGSAQYEADHNTTTDPLADAFRASAADRSEFGFINHTYDHPFLGCSTGSFIQQEITQNVAAGQALGLPVNSTELVTGEHSGLANSRPGNPGVLDPPEFNDVTPGNTAGAALAAGTYDYAVTVSNNHGQTTSPQPVAATVAAGDNSVTATVSTICKGTTYSLYRGTTATGPWTLVAQKTQSGDTPTDNGTQEVPVTLVDTGATVASPVAGTAPSPPTTDTAVMDPYSQNPAFTNALIDAGIANTATDASKTYPVDPLNVAGAQYPAGAQFTLTGAGADSGKSVTTVPRYPTNVFYNTSTESQQLDEYNWIYHAGEGCDTTVRTDCRTTDLTWDQFLATEFGIVFGHITGNDPRPHFVHQSNLSDWNPTLGESTTYQPTQGGILYAYLDNILGYYDGLFQDNAPLVQLTPTAIASALAQQQTWTSNLAAGRVSGYLLNGQIHVDAATPMQVPITGTANGSDYAGTKSGWFDVGAGDTVFAAANPLVIPGGTRPPAHVAKSARHTTRGPRPSLTKLAMRPRRLVRASRGRGRARARAHATITWHLNRAATVHLVFQRKVGHGKHPWLSMGTITGHGKGGRNTYRFAGTAGPRTVTKGSYRIVATATKGGRHSRSRTLTFSVVNR